MSLISSISYDQIEIIENILKLHTKDNTIDCDPTYSKGNFYKNGKIKEPKYKFDINPQTEDIIKADARSLPLDDNSVNCIMFDPPFLATTGKSIKANDNNTSVNICENCGEKNPIDAKFCSKCGSPIIIRCPACGHEMDDGANFCNKCGYKLK